VSANWYPIAFRVGDPSTGLVDYSKDEIDRWRTQVAFWVKDSQPNEPNPVDKAEKIMAAALAGTKINGEAWPGIEHYSLKSRIKMLCGWDIEKGIGHSSNRGLRGDKKAARGTQAANAAVVEEMSSAEMFARRDEFKAIILQQFPWLDNPAYESKVNSLSEAEVRLESLSERFLLAEPKALEQILKVKEALRKDINELMEMLGIHPKQLKDRVDESDRGDVGSLIVKFAELGQMAKDYENVDAIQELIQAVRQAHQTRLDGSPQLAAWLLWHRTGCPGHHFTCECGKTWELYQGFTVGELEAAAEQAYKVFGYGLKRTNEELPSGNREATEAPGTGL
jgi:hypothetical protein